MGADGTIERIAAEQLKPGMVMLVAAGESLAADGTVIDGTSAIDNSMLTGESQLEPVTLDSEVYAGAINAMAPVRVRVEAVASDTKLAEIARLMDEAGQSRSRYVRIADRASRIYAPAVHTLALLAFIGWMLAGAGWHQSLLIAIAVLIITCPCALALAAPGAVWMGIKWMWNPESPFYIRPRLSWDLLSWALRFWQASTAARVKAAEPILRDLNYQSRDIYTEWASHPESGPGDFGLETKGLLMLCRTAKGLEEEAHMAERANQLGVPAKVLDAAGAKKLDPGADLAISALSLPGFLGTEMSSVEFIAVAHPDHALHRLQRELTFQDLETQMQVVIRDSGRLQQRDVGWLGAEQRWTVSSLSTAAHFVSSGLGFAWLPRHLIQRELDAQQLKALPLESGMSNHPRFTLYSHKDKALGPASRILVELIKTYDSCNLDDQP